MRSDDMLTDMLPEGPDDLSEAWLWAALVRSGEVSPTNSVRLLAREEIGFDRGFTGRLFRLLYQVESDRADRSLIAKLPLAPRTTLEAHRRNIESADVSLTRAKKSAREIAFYQYFAGLAGLPVLDCPLAAADLDARRIILLLEDLSDQRAGDALLGCTMDEARQVVRAIARVHAPNWERHDPPEFLTPWPQDHEVAQRSLTGNIERLPSPVLLAVPDDVRQLLDLLAAGAYLHVLTALDKVPKTVIHRDLHLDNVFFLKDDASRPIVIFDWQTVTFGPAVIDLAMFLAQSLGDEAAPAAEDEALDAWLQDLQGMGVTGYGWERLRTDYALALIRVLAGVVTWVANEKWDQVSGRERELAEAALGNGRITRSIMRNGTTDVVRRVLP